MPSTAAEGAAASMGRQYGAGRRSLSSELRGRYLTNADALGRDPVMPLRGTWWLTVLGRYATRPLPFGLGWPYLPVSPSTLAPLGCLSRIGCIVVLAVGGAAAYWLYGDRLPSVLSRAASGAASRVTGAATTASERLDSKQGARIIAAQSKLAASLGLQGIVVAEPTGLAPVRGHRSHIEYTAIARGEQAHSSTGKGLNANWALIPFMVEMKAIYEKLRFDPAYHDAAYDPPFSDFNLIIDNHGTAVNVTVAQATVRIKFRRSRRIDVSGIEAAVQAAAKRAGVELAERREGTPPELPVDHPLIRLAVSITGKPVATAPYGTDASELQDIAPCVILGPGTIATAHTPRECVALADLAAAVPIFRRILSAGAAG